MREILHHLFIPRPSNNHRSKILHHQSLLFATALLLFATALLNTLEARFSQVLGLSTNISLEKLLEETNKRREQEGLSLLRLDSQLSYAAKLKAENMFAQNYWAHNSPDGKTPWTFVKQAGYEYVYAGENLARGFDTSDQVVEAWIRSRSHRENLLSSNYQDIGFAVADGNLLGEQTTLVVQLFGNKSTLGVAGSSPVLERTGKALSSQQLSAQSYPMAQQLSFINRFSFSKNVSIGIVALFLLVFMLDMMIIERKKIIRVVGHNLDHIFFLGGILILLVSVMKGGVL